MFRFDDQVVVIAGGAGGIGSATARLIASLGARIWIVDRDLERGQAEATEIVLAGGVAKLIEADLTDPDTSRDIVERIVAEDGRIDSAIHTVGWLETHPFREELPNYWTKVVDINLMSTIYFCHSVIGTMTERGYGRIVTVASDAGRVGNKGETVYAAAKAGVIGFTKSVAREVAGSGILVNCISPGPTNTPLLEHQDQAVMDAIRRQIPLHRFAEPEEQAVPIAFLASRAASYITGQVLSVSGGLSMVG